MRIYLAGPISGKGYKEVVERYQEKIDYLEDLGYEVFCPMTGKQYLRNELEFRTYGYDEFPVSTNHAIFERDKWMVSNCDILLVDLSNSGERASIGSIMELAWGSLLGKQTIVVLPKENLHRHAFVLEAGDIIFETLEDANNYLKDFINGINGGKNG